MNRLSLPGRLWIASDVHLGPDAPATREAFLAFLDEAAQEADTLILAGDLYDAWIGDDVALNAPAPWLAQTLVALQRVGTRISLWLGHGNRDFLIGERLANHLGARLLPETVVLDTSAGPVLLAHGDEYCLADQRYQRMRRIVRNRAVQGLYLTMPLRWRQNIAGWARRRSMQENRQKTPYIMDVTASAIENAFLSAGPDVHTLIHGHTHRPARHSITVESQPRERLVLPDWDFDHADPPRGGWIAIDAKGIHLRQYEQNVRAAAQASK